MSASRRAETSKGWARRALWPVIVGVGLVGVLFVGVYPTQTYFRQREELDEKQTQLAEARETNADLDARVDQLNEPEELELMAREHYGLVRPGEEVYAVVPGEQPPVALPDSWPFNQLRVRLDRQVD